MSAIGAVAPLTTLALPLGGALLSALTWFWTRQRPAPAVDPVEANALHGGRMSLRDSLFVTVQTDALAVVDEDGRRLGLLSESYVAAATLESWRRRAAT